ncbi:radical SAM protein [Mycobacterium sp.]|uniref:B12-binding domain-containing radical SAM protein n=1 Tax=Mycobacterium sp. TaxID=1785 RepID=UPI002C79D56C|nr:radical SAM protein [Mycobacterium sp.]HTY33959.1 radical SAM protein [Mycobacterium sp.]
MVQPPIWGNLRTPWEMAYVKSFVEYRSTNEVRTFDMAPRTLPLVEAFGDAIRRTVDNSFETECYLSSLAFLTSIAETYLLRLFYDTESEEFRRALAALLRNKTHHRGDALDRLVEAFISDSFFPLLNGELDAMSVQVAEGGYDYLGCCTHITSYGIGLWLLRSVKQLRPDVVTVLSGYQATIDAEETLRACPWIDIVIRGESEGGYLRALSERNRSRRVLDQVAKPLAIDDMPPPDYRDLDLTNYKMISIMASRNCPHGKCLFCQEDAFWSAFRHRGAAKLVDDMEVLHERHGGHRFDFVDLDIRDFVVELCRILRERGHDFGWSGAMRADARTPDVLRAMVPTPCKGIFFGFESGSQRLLRMMRKNITLGTLEATLRTASEVGVRAKLTCIAGLPTETEEEFQSTLGFVERNTEHIRLVLVQCFKLLKRSPLGVVAGQPGNPYGLVPDPVPELGRVEGLLYAVNYRGDPSPACAIERFIEARRAFRALIVDERATLFSTNGSHQKHVLGLR